MELVNKRYYTAHLAILMAFGLYMVIGSLADWIFKNPIPWLPHSIFTPLFGLVGPVLFALRNIVTAKMGDWLYNFLAFVLNLSVVAYLITSGDHFHSPFVIAWMLVCFSIGILGKYLPVAFGGAALLFFVVFQPNQGTIEISVYSIGFVVASLLSCYLSYLFWNRLYLGFDQRVEQQMAKVLDTRNNQSEILASVVSDGVITCNEQRQIALFNPAAAKLTGWSAGDAAGLDISAVFKWVDDKGEPLPADQDPFSQAFSNRKEVRAVNKLQGKAGETTYISVVVSPILTTKNNQMLGLVAILRDVSQEHNSEAQRAEFISTASHEMRTPVAAIEGYLALALNERVATIDERAKNYLEKAHASTQHLGQLFQDLLTSAKAEDGRLTSHPTVVEMGSYLQQLADDLKFSADKKGLFSEFVLGTNEIIDATNSANRIRPLYYAFADPDRLREVITNLFDNACKYTESGKVTLGLTGNAEVVQFYIRDTGHGIPAEDVPHLFQKFYRVDNSATRTIGGTGLGLFICRKIIELYHGHIWVESEIDKGTTFFVNLPRLTDERAEELKASTNGAPSLPDVTTSK